VRVNFGGGLPRSFYAKSLEFTPTSLITSSTVDALFEFLSTGYKNGVGLLVSFHIGGGAVNDVAVDATAYPHRDALFWIQFAAAERGGMSGDTKDFVHGINKIITSGTPDIEFGAYSRHVDPELPNALQAYWGVLPRLEKIKMSIDPNDIFHNPQSVSPARGDDRGHGKNKEEL